MHSLKYYVLLISLIVVLAADKDKEKSQDLLRANTNYAAVQNASNGPTNCDILARYLAAYANSAKANSENYSATAPNYATQISNLYGMINAAQGNAGQSASSASGVSGYNTSPAVVNQQSGYSAPSSATSYSSGGSGYSSSDSAAKPAASAGYSTGGSTYASPSPSPASSYSSGATPAAGYSSGSAGYSSSGSGAKPAASTGYSSGQSSYSAPSPASSYSAGGSGYSSGGSSYGSSKPGSGYSTSTPASGYSSSGSGYSSPSAVKQASGYSSGGSNYNAPASNANYFGYSTPNSYSRFSGAERYMTPAQFDSFYLRNMYAYQPQQANLMNPTFNPAMTYNFENARASPSQEYTSTKTDGSKKPESSPATYTSQKSLPATTSYAAEKPTADSVPQTYSRFAYEQNADLRSSSHGGASPPNDKAVPAPGCPQNYLLSCQSSVQKVPCVQHSQGYSAKY